MNYSELLIKKNKTIVDALNQLNALKDISRLILFVMDDNDVLLGTVTDGDIRRSITKNKNLNKKVIDICNKGFVYSYKTVDYLNLDEFRKNDIKILPILNKDKTISKVIDLDFYKSILPIECMIMAGGRGKRLSPLTDKVPKPMLMLGDKPIIEHNIDRLIKFGINKIYISINYLGQQIIDYFGDGSSKGIEIKYVNEEKFLGTAGALGLVDGFISKHILLMNGDLYTNVDFEELYLNLIKDNADMVVSSTRYKVDIPYAIFDENKFRVNKLNEKPNYTYYSNAGIYIFKKKYVEKIKKNEYLDITDFIDYMINIKKKIIHVPIRGYWIDIGSPNEYKNAKENTKYLNNA